MRILFALVTGLILIWMSGPITPAGESPQRLHDVGQAASGEVVDLHTHTFTQRVGGVRSGASREVTEECPVVSWVWRGEQREFTEFADCDRLEVGDEVTVMFDAKSPEGARIDSDAVLRATETSTMFSWVMRGLGVLLVAVAGWGLVERLRSGSRAAPGRGGAAD